jgi:hypothetical protein
VDGLLDSVDTVVPHRGGTRTPPQGRHRDPERTRVGLVLGPPPHSGLQPDWLGACPARWTPPVHDVAADALRDGRLGLALERHLNAIAAVTLSASLVVALSIPRMMGQDGWNLTTPSHSTTSEGSSSGARTDDEVRHELFKICNENNYTLIDIDFWRPRTNEQSTDAEREAVEQFRLLATAPIPVRGRSDGNGGTVSAPHSGDEPRWDDLVAGTRRIQTDNGYHYDFTGSEDHTTIDQHLGIKSAHFPHHASSRGPEYLGDDPYGLRPHPDGT